MSRKISHFKLEDSIIMLVFLLLSHIFVSNAILMSRNIAHVTAISNVYFNTKLVANNVELFVCLLPLGC